MNWYKKAEQLELPLFPPKEEPKQPAQPVADNKPIKKPYKIVSVVDDEYKEIPALSKFRVWAFSAKQALNNFMYLDNYRKERKLAYDYCQLTGIEAVLDKIMLEEKIIEEKRIQDVKNIEEKREKKQIDEAFWNQ